MRLSFSLKKVIPAPIAKADKAGSSFTGLGRSITALTASAEHNVHAVFERPT